MNRKCVPANAIPLDTGQSPRPNGAVSTVAERIRAGLLADYQIHANCSNRAGVLAGKLAMLQTLLNI